MLLSLINSVSVVLYEPLYVEPVKVAGVIAAVLMVWIFNVPLADVVSQRQVKTHVVLYPRHCYCVLKHLQTYP